MTAKKMIKPALPDAAWRLFLHALPLGKRTAEVFARSWSGGESLARGAVLEYRDQRLPSAEHHAIAALCLYGQPFGFTHEDLEWIRDEAEFHGADAGNPEGLRWRSIADRVAALLPPESGGERSA